MAITGFKEAISAAYRGQQQSPNYIAFRGLVDSDSPNFNYYQSGYNDLLPAFQGQKFIDLINQIIAQGNQVQYIDIGCGEGQAIMDLISRYGKKIRTVGITARQWEASDYKGRVNPSIIKESGAAIFVRDAQKLNELEHDFPNNSFDIATAVRVAEYLADPFGMLRGMYRILKPGGIGLIHGFCFNREKQEDQDKILDYLKKFYYMEIEESTHLEPDLYAFDVALQKQQDVLQLPINYHSIHNSTDRIIKISYTYKG